MGFRQSLHLFLFFLVIGLAYSRNQFTENPPTLSPNSTGAGELQELGGLNCYVSGTADSKISVLLLPDVYGFEVPHLRKLADKVAAAGFYVVVPDFFHGNPYVDGRPFTAWRNEHTPEKGFEDIKPLLEAVKSKGITKIGAGGFCWGGKVNVEIMKNAYIQAGVLLHPTYVSVDDIKGVKVPITILGGEKDNMTRPEVVKQFEAALKEMPEVDSFVKIFPGAPHGWTTRYNDADAVAVEMAEEAHKIMLDWFIKYLK